MFFRYLTCVVPLIFQPSDTNALVYAKTYRDAFLASQAWASYWSKSVPAAHLSRPAPWHSYSSSELRDAHIRYAASQRRWESPSPAFKAPIRLAPPQTSNGLDYSQRWRLIRGTRWAWSFQHSTGEVRFCDLRAGLVIGKWSARGPVVDAFIESRSPHECILGTWDFQLTKSKCKSTMLQDHSIALVHSICKQVRAGASPCGLLQRSVECGTGETSVRNGVTASDYISVGWRCFPL